MANVKYFPYNSSSMKWFLLALFIFASGCDFTPVKRLISPEVKKEEKKSAKSPPKKAEPSPPKADTPPPPIEPPPPAADYLKQVVPSQPLGSAPLTSFLHLGGAPTLLLADANHVYLGSGPVLSLYDLNLNPQGTIRLEKPALSVTAAGDYLYVKEEGNVLEIARGGEIVKSFQAGGAFDATADRKLFVYLPDKIQVLD
ncbi:MAG: hypothetical protein Q7T11_06810, partial [Deltaproteobacteria bacterium]|nr:hypothetical protein [Deltaproteobacteria bacterium]